MDERSSVSGQVSRTWSRSFLFVVWLVIVSALILPVILLKRMKASIETAIQVKFIFENCEKPHNKYILLGVYADLSAE